MTISCLLSHIHVSTMVAFLVILYFIYELFLFLLFNCVDMVGRYWRRCLTISSYRFNCKVRPSITFSILDAECCGYACQASCTSQRNQKSELMEGASTIHLYTSTPPLTCDGRRESQHMDTKGGDNNFTINCENQDSNSRPWALIPC
jgi:hypothetical protein